MQNEAVVIAVIQLVLTLAAATVAILPALMKMRSEKAKAEADTIHTLTDSALAMVETWEKRVQKLEATVRRLEESEEFWKRGCYKLLKQIIDLGYEPCWDPNGVTKPSEQEE